MTNVKRAAGGRARRWILTANVLAAGLSCAGNSRLMGPLPPDVMTARARAESDPYPPDIEARLQRGDPSAWPIVVRGLEADERLWLKSRAVQLAILAGRDARPVVDGLIALTRSENDSRALAAGALGWMGAVEAADALETALSSYSWKAAGAAAWSLGHLGLKAVPAALAKAAAEHPLPAVRSFARASIADIRLGRSDPLDHKRYGGPDIGVEAEGRAWKCDVTMPPRTPTPTVVVTESASPPAALVGRALSTYLTIDGGWLAGWDYGEWGGVFAFVPAIGPVQKLVSGNVRYVARTGPDDYRVLTGQPNPWGDDAWTWKITGRPGQFSARRFAELPSMPTDIAEHANGIISASTIIGRVLVGPAGLLRAAPCHYAIQEVAEIVQAFLDYSLVRDAITARIGDAGLVLESHRLADSGVRFSFRGRPVEILAEVPQNRATASFYSIRVSFSSTYQTQIAKVRLSSHVDSFVYEAMVERGSERWLCRTITVPE